MSEKLSTRVAMSANLLAIAAITGCGASESDEDLNLKHILTVCDEGPRLFPSGDKPGEISARISSFRLKGTEENLGALSIGRGGSDTFIGIGVDDRPENHGPNDLVSIEYVYEGKAKDPNKAKFDLVGAIWKVYVTDDGTTVVGKCD